MSASLAAFRSVHGADRCTPLVASIQDSLCCTFPLYFGFLCIFFIPSSIYLFDFCCAPINIHWSYFSCSFCLHFSLRFSSSMDQSIFVQFSLLLLSPPIVTSSLLSLPANVFTLFLFSPRTFTFIVPLLLCLCLCHALLQFTVSL